MRKFKLSFIIVLLALVSTNVFSQLNNKEALLAELESFHQATVLVNPEVLHANPELNQFIDHHDHTAMKLVPLVIHAGLLDRIDQLEIDYLLQPRKQTNVKMISYDEVLASRVDCELVWEAYPTYETYEQVMIGYEQQYPELVKLHDLGTVSAEGRRILAVQIGDNNAVREDEPRFLYTSSMHGDETAGFPMMLRLIEHLLCNYGQDDRITNLIDNVDIWINPLANPDGTYFAGNESVDGAIRFTENFIDINRNFPDPEDGPNPDGNAYEPETQVFMDFAEAYKFNLSCNMHGGVEVANYPWDTWSKRAADDAWWQHVCDEYATSAKLNSPDGYFTFYGGVTNGFDWYEVQGGRQDFTTYFHRGRELTLELSDRKLLQTDEFVNHWNYNKESLLNFLDQSLYGLRGIVTDSQTGVPLNAHIFIETHDVDQSDVFTDPEIGNYHRYLFEGTYDVTFEAEGYDAQTITVDIMNNQSTRLDVQLTSVSVGTTNIFEDNSFDYTIANGTLSIQSNLAVTAELNILGVGGQLLAKYKVLPFQNLNVSINELPKGVVLANIHTDEKQGMIKIPNF